MLDLDNKYTVSAAHIQEGKRNAVATATLRGWYLFLLLSRTIFSLAPQSFLSLLST